MQRPRERRRALAVALALAYGIVLAWQAPHLVHHALETHTAAPDECALAAAADHGPASLDAAAPDVPVQHGAFVGTSLDVSCRVADLSTAPSRAPPAVSA
jgi:hypothetical protein